MTPAELSRTVQHALHDVLDGAWADAVPGRVVIESPPRRGSGDYATGAVLQAARVTGENGHALAGRVGALLARVDGIAAVEVSGPGFLNVTLDAEGRAALVRGLAGPYESAVDQPERDARRWAAATGEPYEGLLRRTDASSLFRVQYAHARARALLRNAVDLGVVPEPGADGYAYEAPAERALLALLADTLRIAEAAVPAATAAPAEVTAPAAPAQPSAPAETARLARHLTDIADAGHAFHEACPPLPRGDEKPEAAHRARLALTEACGTVLAGGLAQFGVTAPAYL